MMVNFAVVGIGNWGAAHLDAARKVADAGCARFTAVADIHLSAFPEIVEELRGRGVACYETHREMLDKHPELDFITLPVPIQLHAPMTIECLERGLHVLVEKPPAATLAEARQMTEVARRVGKLCGVAFQYSTSPLQQAMLDLITRGKLGTITALSTLNLGKRYDNYYARAPWAGKLRMHGTIVHDGTLNNPYAHMAQMLFTVAQAAAGAPVLPVTLQAELFAGHDIETEDTAAIRAQLSCGAALHFYSSVCTHEGANWQMRIEGTQGVVTWGNMRAPQAQVEYADGAIETLPDLITPEGGTTEALFRNFIQAVEGKAALACPIEETLSFAEFVERVFEGEQITYLHGTPYVTRVEVENQEMATYLQDVESYAQQAYASGKLFSEVGAPWATPAG